MSITIEFVPSAAEQAPDVPGLKKPYKFRLSIAEVRQLVTDYNALAFSLLQDGARLFVWSPAYTKDGKPKWYRAAHTDPVKYGVKLGCWSLAHKIEDFGPDNGCTEAEWTTFTARMTSFLQERLPGCEPYAEGWEARKPQFRFETYIRFTEHDQ